MAKKCNLKKHAIDRAEKALDKLDRYTKLGKISKKMHDGESRKILKKLVK